MMVMMSSKNGIDCQWSECSAVWRRADGLKDLRLYTDAMMMMFHQRSSSVICIEEAIDVNRLGLVRLEKYRWLSDRCVNLVNGSIAEWIEVIGGKKTGQTLRTGEYKDRLISATPRSIGRFFLVQRGESRIRMKFDDVNVSIKYWLYLRRTTVHGVSHRYQILLVVSFEIIETVVRHCGRSLIRNRSSNRFFVIESACSCDVCTIQCHLTGIHL